MARLSSGEPEPSARRLEKVSSSWTAFGSNPGTEAIARTAPVAGSIATSAPPGLSGSVTAACRPSVAIRCASESSVSVMSAPAGCWSRSWSMIDANSFSSPISRSFSDDSIPDRPTSTKL